MVTPSGQKAFRIAIYYVPQVQVLSDISDGTNLSTALGRK